jgi:hypothetical protein
MPCSDHGEPIPCSNPFATRFIRPDAGQYVFPSDFDGRRLLERLRRHNGWGQIVGPHGSGKSTLLYWLIPRLREAGRTPLLAVLHQGQSRLVEIGIDLTSLTSQHQLILDGYEQLNWLARRRVRGLCRRAKAGLLVTTHRPLGLPDIWQTEPSLELTLKLARRLMPAEHPIRLSDRQIAESFHSCQGNIRETWFQLYDIYEAARSSQSLPSS